MNSPLLTPCCLRRVAQSSFCYYSTSPTSFLTRALHLRYFSTNAKTKPTVRRTTRPQQQQQQQQQPIQQHSPASALSPIPSLGSSLVPTPHPLSARLNIITEEEKQEQLALIDELTDYLRSYTQPSSDSAAKAAANNPNLTICHADFFLSRPEITVFYNKFIRNHAVHHAVEQGLAVEQQMIRKGIKADDKTYNALIEVCGSARGVTIQDKQQLIEKLFTLYQQSLSVNPKPQLLLFNAMIVACSRLGNSAAALRALALLQQQSHLKPNVYTYTSLIGLYRDRSIPFDSIREFWFQLRGLDMAEQKRTDLTHSYNAIIAAAAFHAETEWALQLYTDMQQRGFHPNADTYRSLMLACARRPDYYLKCFSFFEQALTLQFKPDTFMMTTLLTACCKNADLTNALTVFQQMKDCGIERTTISYNALIHTIANTQRQPVYTLLNTQTLLSQKDRMEMTERLLIQMEANGIRVDDVTLFNALRVWTCALRLNTAEEVRQRLIQRYVHKDRVSAGQTLNFNDGRGEYNVRLWECLLQMFIVAQKVNLSMNCLHQMSEYGLHPDKRYYDQLLHLCTKLACEAEGQAVLQQMAAHNMTPSSPSHAALFDRVEYAKQLRKQQETAMEGAVRVLPVVQQQALSDRAWLGLRQRPSSTRQRQSEPKKLWIQSKQEKKAREQEYLRQRRKAKQHIEEKL